MGVGEIADGFAVFVNGFHGNACVVPSLLNNRVNVRTHFGVVYWSICGDVPEEKQQHLLD